MHTIRPDRKARFKAALALSGTTMSEWADRAGVVRQHVHQTLRYPEISAPLTEKIDAFIADVEQKAKAVA